MLSGISLGWIWPVSIKCGAPVVYFLVKARVWWMPSFVIDSQLYSGPSIKSSITTIYYNGTQEQFETLVANNDYLTGDLVTSKS